MFSECRNRAGQLASADEESHPEHADFIAHGALREQLCQHLRNAELRTEGMSKGLGIAGENNDLDVCCLRVLGVLSTPCAPRAPCCSQASVNHGRQPTRQWRTSRWPWHSI